MGHQLHNPELEFLGVKLHITFFGKLGWVPQSRLMSPAVTQQLQGKAILISPTIYFCLEV